MKLEGKKLDDKKIPLWLLPKPALIEVARVLAFGATKYDEWNWFKGFKYSRLLSAATRHLYAFETGENDDPETDISHLAHSTCCLLFLLSHRLHNLGIDDRHAYKKKPSNANRTRVKRVRCRAKKQKKYSALQIQKAKQIF